MEQESKQATPEPVGIAVGPTPAWSGGAQPGGISLLAVRYGIYLAFVLYLVAMSWFARPHFLTVYNLLNVLRQTAPVLITAVGMTFVIGTAGIDLSVGSMVALVSVLTSDWLRDGLSTEAVVPLALGVGAIVGLLNGYFSSYQRLPPFVVTLATLTLVRGVAFVYSKGYSVPVYNESFNTLGRGQIGPIHTPIIIAAVVVLLGQFILTQTRFGRYVLAVGGREEAAHLQGIKVNVVKLWVYAGTGVLAALAGVIITGRLGNGSPNAGLQHELEAITAVVLGGTNLFGGEATIGGTVIGALFINFIRNGLNLKGVDPFWVQVVTGFILLLAIWFNTWVNRRVTNWVRLAGLRGEAE